MVWPNLTILPFDAAAAHTYGQLRARLERSGTLTSEPDLRIASIAITQKLTLITGNVRHFAKIRALTLENWLR